MIRKVFIADCDNCHELFTTDDSPLLRMTTGEDGMEIALRGHGWYCGFGPAPQVLCPNCNYLKENGNNQKKENQNENQKNQ